MKRAGAVILFLARTLRRSLDQPTWTVLVLVMALVSFACSNSTSPTEPDGFTAIAPACANPAPLLGEFDEQAPHVIIVFRDGYPTRTTAESLAEEYDLTVLHVHESLCGFTAAGMTPASVAALRCEPSVEYIEFDMVVRIAG